MFYKGVYTIGKCSLRKTSFYLLFKTHFLKFFEHVKKTVLQNEKKHLKFLFTVVIKLNI